MDFNKEKFKMVLHYIINKSGVRNTVGRTVLHKLLYFSDFNHYELYEKSITNETYIKKSRGPIPIHFEEAIDELEAEQKITRGKRKLPCGKTMNRYYSIKEPSVDLTEDELAVIDKVIKEIGRLNGLMIGRHSLEDKPTKQAKEGEIIDYNLVFERNAKYSKRPK